MTPREVTMPPRDMAHSQNDVTCQDSDNGAFLTATHCPMVTSKSVPSHDSAWYLPRVSKACSSRQC